jgi:hypothetical protein
MPAAAGVHQHRDAAPRIPRSTRIACGTAAAR